MENSADRIRHLQPVPEFTDQCSILSYRTNPSLHNSRANPAQTCKNGGMARLKTLPEAIATMEGFYATPATRAFRNRNPGNIEWGSFAQSHGATGVEPDGKTYKGRFAVFSTAQDGFDAWTALLLGNVYRTLTIEQAINRYAPPKENDSVNYVKAVCGWVGCQSHDTVEKVMTQA